MRMARVQDGEAFALLANNPQLASPVKLDLRLIEADQVTFTDLSLLAVPSIDGIVFDDYGNPVEYHVLRIHPGQYAFYTGARGFPWEYDRIPARDVIHWFRSDRPAQHRGLPELLPALPLFAQLRRFTLAVLDAAEAAADFAIVLYTRAPADGAAAEVEPMDVIELERRMMTTMPEGWEPGQIKAEQPATTYAEFKKEILNEIARCLNVPFNVAAGNSSGYNYASGRLDHQVYFRSIRIDQASAASVVLDRLLNAWLDEAILVSNLLPLSARTIRDFPHQWFWDGHEHVDPLKEAQAQAARLASNTTTLADEFARKGQDWEAQLRQRAKEVALVRELGLPASTPATGPAQPQDKVPVAEEDRDDEPPSADETEDI
jgi:lambda family phage portal protein